MTDHIVLTEEQSDAIRGDYGIYSRIEPVISGTNRIIPDRCLWDEDLSSAKSQLANLSKAIVSNDDKILVSNNNEGIAEND